MKITTTFLLIHLVFCCYSQNLPIDFEDSIVTSDFVDFDGGTAMVMDNPFSSGINTSSKVAQIVRNGGLIWSGSKISLSSNLEFTSMNSIKMKVYTSAPIGTIIKFKLEGAGGSAERDVETTVKDEWEELNWDFTGTSSNFNDLVFMFDFGNVGDGSITSTFLFDDIQQVFTGAQIDFPVTFDEIGINYTVTDFGGNQSDMVADPMNSNNNVIEVVKTDQAAAWAGTTIGTPAGFATNVPLTLTDSKMYVNVWSPDSGIPIRLKVEDSNDPTHTCETEAFTTLAGEWEVLEFDFTNQALGTESLSVGLSMGWTYNMASIFFNFGTEGVTAGEKTYYFDNVNFGEPILSTDVIDLDNLNIFPNPTGSSWNFVSQEGDIKSLIIYDLKGELLLETYPNKSKIEINAAEFNTGFFISRISTRFGTQTFKLMKI